MVIYNYAKSYQTDMKSVYFLLRAESEKYQKTRGDNMSEYVITTDNNSDLPEEYLKDHGVGCMYLSYSMDGKNYTHGNFLPEHEFYCENEIRTMELRTEVLFMISARQQ